ncbi:hypothetical protein APR43_16420 [Flavobacterium sp. NLM]|nr:hypothetical protein AKO67_17135 [Flavobacterium sp. VMW]OWU89774.1 hypothetical protein APR43_16420 [Flavobacterium sp. NLM]
MSTKIGDLDCRVPCAISPFGRNDNTLWIFYNKPDRFLKPVRFGSLKKNPNSDNWNLEFKKLEFKFSKLKKNPNSDNWNLDFKNFGI